MKRSLFCLALLLLMGFLCSQSTIACAEATSSSVKLVFNELSVVKSKEYALGDLARIETQDAQEQLRLSCLVLGKSPAVGYRMNITARQLLLELGRKGISEPRFSFAFPAGMVLEREAQTVEPKTLEEAVRSEVLAQLPDQSEPVIVDNIVIPQSIVLPAGNLTTEVEVRMPRRGVGSGSYQLNILVDGENQRKLSGSFQVDMEVTALQVTKTVDRGQVVDMQNCREVKKRLTQLPNRPISAKDLELSLRARRNLMTGDILSWSDLDREMLVKRGQAVSMVLETADGMRISAQGQARGNGFLGDAIEVVNLSSGKVVQGVVAGNHLVKVLF